MFTVMGGLFVALRQQIIFESNLERGTEPIAIKNGLVIAVGVKMGLASLSWCQSALLAWRALFTLNTSSRRILKKKIKPNMY